MRNENNTRIAARAKLSCASMVSRWRLTTQGAGCVTVAYPTHSHNWSDIYRILSLRAYKTVLTWQPFLYIRREVWCKPQVREMSVLVFGALESTTMHTQTRRKTIGTRTAVWSSRRPSKDCPASPADDACRHVRSALLPPPLPSPIPPTARALIGYWLRSPRLATPRGRARQALSLSSARLNGFTTINLMNLTIHQWSVRWGRSGGAASLGNLASCS